MTFPRLNKPLAVLAALVSGIAIVLAMDPGHFAFKNVDVGGHSLRMLISGHGSPAVVFESGGSPADGGPLEDWELVQPAIGKVTTAVSYDRAGIAWSAPASEPRDARLVARELHTALAGAHVPPPYVLVGHSFGGPLIRVFAGMYPDEVAGLVLIDPTQEEFINWNDARQTNQIVRQDDEGKDIRVSLEEAHESRVPAGVPVTLITAMGPRVFPSFIAEKDRQEFKVIKPMWLKFHNEWVEKVPDAKHIVTLDSGHMVQFEQPDLVINSILEIVQQGRGRQEPAPTQKQPLVQP
jgi:pimeloyl-ACP methyl ester carboxylesterase